MHSQKSTIASIWTSLLIIVATVILQWRKKFNKFAASAYLATYKVLGATSLGASSGTLTVCDNRTNRKYTIPIEHNSIKATEFRKITAAGRGADPVDQVESGLRVVDRGYMNTACMESSITLIDGKKGYIQYRDYSIEYLFANHDYEEVIHLLIWGHLPSPQEKLVFRRSLAAAAVPSQSVIDVIQAFPRDALTFTMILAGLAAVADTDEGSHAVHSSGRPKYLGNMKECDAALIRAYSGLGSVIAITYCHKRGKQFTQPDPEGSFIGNMLKMMGFTDEKGTPTQEIEDCFKKLWILYADHEMTNSTAAFLHAASTLTDPISCSITGMVSAYGPLHGGAIDLAYKGFEEIGSPDNVHKLIADVKAKKQRLFGYGHRIYKAVDPRANFICSLINEHKDKVKSNPLLNVAFEIDRVANDDPYFTSRNLKANADLYGCFLYTALGFETDIIIAMASLSRSAGVLAHWRESMTQPPALWRPLQIFTGTSAQETM